MKQVKVKSEPKPPWLKIKPPGGDKYLEIKGLMRKHNLYTVCEEARCPNVSECWGGGTATIMLLGDTCTRNCKFCHVKTGNPRGKVDELEPQKVGQTIGQLGLTYVVLTSVDRDDLPDGGADHFARTVEEIKKLDQKVLVEVLVPDFRGDEKAIHRLVESGANVLAHNLETVERLTPRVRDPRAPYAQSLDVLGGFKKYGAKYTKSSLMVGLGETQEEISQAMDDLRRVGVDIITLGQYLQPSPKHLKVAAYIHPEQFKEYEAMAKEKGFLYVASGALVRSSYRAGELFLEGLLRKNDSH